MFNVVRKGFDQNQVLEYLNRVADLVQTLESRARRLESELEETRRQRGETLGQQAFDGPDPYESASARLADLMRSFDHDVERLRREAEMEAERILADARAEADSARHAAEGIEEEAKVRAELLLREARKEADQVNADVATLRGAALNEFGVIRSRMQKVIYELDAVLDKEPGQDQVVVVDDVGERASTDQALPRLPDVRSDFPT